MNISDHINHKFSDDHGGVIKPQSVRSQRSFTEHMATLYQNIDTLVYAAEVACKDNSDGPYHCPLGKKCAFKNPTDHMFSCRIDSMRMVIGDHFPQGDIKELDVTE